MTRVLHLTGWPIPDCLAGTEIYILSLSRALAAHGVQSFIGCLDNTSVRSSSRFDGIDVGYFKSIAESSTREFEDTITSWQPDVVNIHAITHGLALEEVQAVAGLKIPIVMTIHQAAAYCQSGTMVLNGAEPCDGEVIPRRCATCYSHRQGLPVAIGSSLNRLPAVVRTAVATCSPRRFATLLRLPELLTEKKRGFDSLVESCERVIAVCQWLMDALARNGVPEWKLRLSRQATDEVSEPRARGRQNGELTIGYVGRYYPLKGVHTIIEAVRLCGADAPVRLLLRGTVSAAEDTAYLENLKELADCDPRIEIGGPLDRQDLSHFFERIDCLAVPSTCLETGPLVAYEALAHRVPVLGSRLGGISELIEEGRNGFLLSPGNAASWSARLRELLDGVTQLPILGRESALARTWNDAALEMAGHYSEVLAGAGGRAPDKARGACE